MELMMKSRLLAVLVLVGMALTPSIVPTALPAGESGMSMKTVYPNPFTDHTTFQLTMPRAGNIRIAVYDIVGKHIKLLMEGMHAAGFEDVPWDGKDEAGNPVPPGIYICSLFADNSVVTSVKVVKIAR
jgi:flagellar hook assembly protein FlgD